MFAPTASTASTIPSDTAQCSSTNLLTGYIILLLLAFMLVPALLNGLIPATTAKSPSFYARLVLSILCASTLTLSTLLYYLNDWITDPQPHPSHAFSVGIPWRFAHYLAATSHYALCIFYGTLTIRYSNIHGWKSLLQIHITWALSLAVGFCYRTAVFAEPTVNEWNKGCEGDECLWEHVFGLWSLYSAVLIGHAMLVACSGGFRAFFEKLDRGVLGLF